MFAKRPSSLPEGVTTYDILKSLAVILMIVDHIGYYFYPDQEWWRAVGRICVPIWLFLIGYARSRSIDMRLVTGAGVLIFASWAAGLPFLPVNILVSIILIRLVLDPIIRFIGKDDMNLLLVTTGAIILAPLSGVFWEYGTFGLVFALCGHMVRNGFGANKTIPLLYGTVCVTAFTTIQHNVFHFDMLQDIVVALGSGVMMVLLFAWLPRTTDLGFAINSRFAREFLRFTGRHTLEIYVIHLLIFKLIYVGICGCTQCVCKPHFNPMSLISL